MDKSFVSSQQVSFSFSLSYCCYFFFFFFQEIPSNSARISACTKESKKSLEKPRVIGSENKEAVSPRNKRTVKFRGNVVEKTEVAISSKTAETSPRSGQSVKVSKLSPIGRVSSRKRKACSKYADFDDVPRFRVSRTLNEINASQGESEKEIQICQAADRERVESQRLGERLDDPDRTELGNELCGEKETQRPDRETELDKTGASDENNAAPEVAAELCETGNCAAVTLDQRAESR